MPQELNILLHVGEGRSLFNRKSGVVRWVFVGNGAISIYLWAGGSWVVLFSEICFVISIYELVASFFEKERVKDSVGRWQVSHRVVLINLYLFYILYYFCFHQSEYFFSLHIQIKLFYKYSSKTSTQYSQAHSALSHH